MFVEIGSIHTFHVFVIQIVFEIHAWRDHLLLKHIIATKSTCFQPTDHATRNMTHVLELRLLLNTYIHTRRAHGQVLFAIRAKLSVTPRRMQRHLLIIILTISAYCSATPSTLTQCT